MSGYLGGAALLVWDRTEPLIEAERQKRRDAGVPDPGRWQEYFELLVTEFRRHPPGQARRKARFGRL